MGEQIRAARALLKMTLKDLADASGVSVATIIRAEASDGVPSVTRANLASIQRALEAAGVEFIDATGGGTAIRRRVP